MPAPSTVDTRNRILVATNELFRRQGYNGTSLSQIVKASGATTGSVYHFFPGGKDELTIEVLRTSGEAYAELVAAIIGAAIDPAAGVADAFAGAAQLLVESDFIDPCPIGTIAREVASTNERLRGVAAEVMNGWVDRFAALLREAGVGADDAVRLAATLVTSIEGAFILARTTRRVDALLAVGETVQALIAETLARD